MYNRSVIYLTCQFSIIVSAEGYLQKESTEDKRTREESACFLGEYKSMWFCFEQISIMGVFSMGQQLCSDQARHSASPGPNTVQWGSMRTGWELTVEMFCMNVGNSGIVPFFLFEYTIWYRGVTTTYCIY